MTSTSQVRGNLFQFFVRDLVGPAHGEEEKLEESPKIRYGAGILFPQESERNESDAVNGVEGGTDEGDESEVLPEGDSNSAAGKGKKARSVDTDESSYDDTVTLANTFRPSAIGLSFMVDADCAALMVEARAATYKSGSEDVERPDGTMRSNTTWTRAKLPLEPVTITLEQATSDLSIAPGLSLRVVARAPRQGGRLVTMSLYNTTFDRSRSATTFFQVGFRVRAPDQSPVFPEYRTLEGIPEDDEETALRMLYRKRRVFGAGHGCAASWTSGDELRAHTLETSVIPSVRVPPVVPLSFRAQCLDMEYLAGSCDAPSRDIPAALEELCTRYERWILDRRTELSSLDGRFQSAARRHLSFCETALNRMRSGIQLLAEDDAALRAFMLVNKAMLMQQTHARLRRTLSDDWEELPGHDQYTSVWGGEKTRTVGYWRAFQIAFVLLNLRGLVPGEHRVQVDNGDVLERELVDLIWFPTGGGKTEAYLGVTAFVIFTSRMYDRDRCGCRVLMRYTLRLLTSQQFQRAASLVCACELIRRNDPATFGDTPISIGLWVGMSLTPNDETDALNKLRALNRRGREAKNPFQLLSCPWCGTELDNPDKLGYVDRNGRQVFQCPASQCPFGSRAACLPVRVVDESIYREPPTVLIGTVDKFAMLAWRPDAGTILQAGGGPDLIIQDELHLISGPLGSMVGLYEGVIEYLCSSGKRRPPKIIASTATIRRAEQQCRQLYDRPMLQFPPPGLDASDSFFAAEDPEGIGHMYVGFLPTAASSPLTAQIRSVVALQQGALSGSDAQHDEELDPYWTLVQYFGSLKELGRAATFITADIPEFLPTMHRRYQITGDERRFVRNAEELTSRKNEDEIPKILKRLEQPYRANSRPFAQALDTVLATNMISVGVDVDRLGLMMIVTQPKGTSEYIQASSRVGRRHPGLVVTLYNAGRPRDRSHYEQFVGYHQAFYRYVEPTSVTPFSPPAMTRALHAVLVIAARHVCGWKRPDEVNWDSPEFNEFLEFMRSRVRKLDTDHESEFEHLLNDKMTDWVGRLPDSWGSLARKRDERALMRVAGSPPLDDDDAWETPTSMRNVDVECEARVIPRYAVPGAEG